MFSRQRALLRFIENEGGRIERLRLVKLAFLISRDPRSPRTGVYDFVPYKRGPFSFSLYNDLRSLGRDGWVREDNHVVEVACLPTIQTAFLDSDFLARIDSISKAHRNCSTSDLVDDIYIKHPWFTINADAVAKRRAARPSADIAIYTVGYEGLSVDALLDLLLRAGIKALIDVRCNPVARRYGFHKSTAARLCADLGIQYIHFPSLGVPSSWRQSLSDAASYNHLWGRYENEILPGNSVDVDRVASLVRQQPSALMCMEADHLCCHRSRLAAEVSRRVNLSVKELRTCE